MFRLPDREDVELLAATLYATEPLPDPLAPPVTVIQGAPLVAVQAHPASEVTVTAPVDALPPTDTPAGEMDQLHWAENASVLDPVLRPTPLGPTAATRAS